MSFKFDTMDELVNIILTDKIMRKKALTHMGYQRPTNLSFLAISGCSCKQLERFNEGARRQAWAQLLIALKPELKRWSDKHDQFIDENNPHHRYPLGYDYIASMQPNQKENITMKLDNTNPVQSITFIFGQDLDTMTPDQLISAITGTQDKINKLEELSIDSKYVAKQTKAYEKAIGLLVKELDKR